MDHFLKTWTQYFEKVATGVKSCEVRKNDRNYQVGDRLVLCEIMLPEREHFTGRVAIVNVTDMVDNPEFLQPGYVALSIHLKPGHSMYCAALQKEQKIEAAHYLSDLFKRG